MKVIANLVNSNFVEKAKAMAENVVTEEDLKAPVVVGGPAAVKEAKVTGEKEITVTFESAVDKTADVKFTFTGPASITQTVTWDSTQKVAKIASSAVILEGAYTIKAEGTNVDTAKATATFVVAKNGAGTIEFLSDKLIKTRDHSTTGRAYVYFKVMDKYGKDTTSTVVASDLNISASRSFTGTPEISSDNKNRMVIDFADNSGFGTDIKNVTVTIIDKNTGVSVSKSLEVADKAQVSELTFGTITYPVESPVLTAVKVDKVTAAYIPIVAKDQYGNAVIKKTDATSFADITNDITFVASDSALPITAGQIEEYVDTATAVKGIRFVVNTDNITIAKTVMLTAVSNLNGKSASISFDTKEVAKAEKIQLGSQAQTVAKGDAKEMLRIPLTVYDSEGILLSIDDIIKNIDDGNLTISVSDALKVGGSSSGAPLVTYARTGEYKGMIVNSDPLLTSPPTATGIITVSTSKNVATYTVDMKDAAYPREVYVNTAPAANMLMGAFTQYNYKFMDQYGRTLPDSMLSTSRSLVKFTVSNGAIAKIQALRAATLAPAPDFVDTDSDGTFDGEDGTTKVTSTEATGEQVIWTKVKYLYGSKAVRIDTNTANTEGSTNVRAELYKLNTAGAANEKTMTNWSSSSTLDTTIQVTKGVPSSLTFEIQDIPTLYAPMGTIGLGNDGSVALNGADPYAYPVTVLAKNGSTSYALPTNRILSVTTTDTSYIGISGTALGDVTLSNQDYKWVVGAKDADGLGTATATGLWTNGFKAATDPDTKEVSIKVTISTDAGIKDITKTFSVSKEVKKAVSVKFAQYKDGTGGVPVDTAEPDKLNSDSQEVTSLTGTAATIKANWVYVYEIDQYGVYTSQGATPTLTNASPDRFVNAITMVGNKLVFNKEQAKANEDIFVMYKAASGAYNTFKMKVTDGLTALDVTAPTVVVTTTGNNNGAIAAAETLIMTFNEAMDPTTVTVANIDTVLAPSGGHSHLDGDGAMTSATWSVGNTVLTITYLAGTSIPDVASGDTITPTLTDLAGNQVAAFTIAAGEF
jgi:hypothetical protein